MNINECIVGLVDISEHVFWTCNVQPPAKIHELQFTVYANNSILDYTGDGRSLIEISVAYEISTGLISQLFQNKLFR